MNDAMNLPKILKRFRVEKGGKFRLSQIDPGDTCGLDLDKEDVKRMMADNIKKLSKLQELLYADNRRTLLAIFQAMDAAGKDGVIEHVMSGINPQGCEVHPFKAPSAEELDHDFLWRFARRLPERGRIGIFNRSYYEETLVVRVHPELLERQRLPEELVGKDIWKERFKSIRHFERHLAQNGTKVLKFHLRISKEEQRQRFLDRLEEPDKRWKFNVADVTERERWDDYMAVYEDMIRETASEHAPWYVVPADNKSFARLVVAAALIDVLDGFALKAPRVALSPELERMRLALLHEGRAVPGKKAAAKKRSASGR
jgi:PPK2 family polyphosphate:nucleotide phosphotransferase